MSNEQLVCPFCGTSIDVPPSNSAMLKEYQSADNKVKHNVNHGCVFDRGSECQVLSEKVCASYRNRRCTFYKVETATQVPPPRIASYRKRSVK